MGLIRRPFLLAALGACLALGAGTPAPFYAPPATITALFEKRARRGRGLVRGSRFKARLGWTVAQGKRRARKRRHQLRHKRHHH